MGCVATPGDGLVKVAIILTPLNHRHLFHELQISQQAGRHFPTDIILWGERFYCLYPMSYRQLSEMMCGAWGGSGPQHAFALAPEVCALIWSSAPVVRK